MIPLWSATSGSTRQALAVTGQHAQFDLPLNCNRLHEPHAYLYGGVLEMSFDGGYRYRGSFH